MYDASRKMIDSLNFKFSYEMVIPSVSNHRVNFSQSLESYITSLLGSNLILGAAQKIEPDLRLIRVTVSANIKEIPHMKRLTRLKESSDSATVDFRVVDA
jgi:hypothetical protein